LISFLELPQKEPVIFVIAGSNGAGKSTFYHSLLKSTRLRFINPDEIANDLGLDAYEASDLASKIRDRLVDQRESFIFETVFSDPAGDKLQFLESAMRRGYSVILCFIGISSPTISEQRVDMRVAQGGHDVPRDKLHSRFSRTLANLRAAIQRLPVVVVFDNDDLLRPYRLTAVYKNGERVFAQATPSWLDR